MNGHSIPKSDPQILAVGVLDETQSWIGLVISDLSPACTQLESKLLHVQSLLYLLQADISIDNRCSIHDNDVTIMEHEIDSMMSAVPAIHAFILPGGGHTGAQLQYARTLARGAERACVAFHSTRPDRVQPESMRFINRLSDYLFAMALYANHLDGIPEKMSRES
ncbi:cob(I)yrinic acid a,c-diamide adenosyltransferase [Bifidobacterium aquikefiri]